MMLYVWHHDVKLSAIRVVVQLFWLESSAIPLRALRQTAFKDFDRKGRKEISAKFAKKNEHSETAPTFALISAVRDNVRIQWSAFPISKPLKAVCEVSPHALVWLNSYCALKILGDFF
jgi:hypothetical protein